MENKNRLIQHGGVNGDLSGIFDQEDELETILQQIAELVRFNRNGLYIDIDIEKISEYLLLNGLITLKTFNTIKSICEGDHDVRSSLSP